MKAPAALLPIRAIGSLNKRELLNLCVDDMFGLLKRKEGNSVLLVHAVQVLHKLGYGLVVHKTPRPGAIHVFNRKLAGQPLTLAPVPIWMLTLADNKFV